MVLEKWKVVSTFLKDHASIIYIITPGGGVYNKVFYRHTT